MILILHCNILCHLGVGIHYDCQEDIHYVHGTEQHQQAKPKSTKYGLCRLKGSKIEVTQQQSHYRFHCCYKGREVIQVRHEQDISENREGHKKD